MFERTKQGQQNRASFYDADLICFVEGGGGQRDYSPDVTFWYSIFSHFRPDLVIKFLARGGKPELEKIASNIVDRDVADNLVALDSDFDDFLGDKIEDRRVLYTYGYSWENDVLCPGNLIRTYSRLCHCQDIPQVVESDIRKNLTALRRDLRRLVFSDFIAVKAGTSVISRRSPEQLIESIDGLPPRIRISRVRACISRANHKKKRPAHAGKISPVDPIRYLAGAMLVMLMSKLMSYIVSRHHGRRRLSYVEMRDYALHGFGDFLIQHPNSNVAAHFRKACNSV